MSILLMRDIRLSYGSNQALAGVDVDIAPGEMVALTGRSGSGKSSLLNIAAGLVHPTSGGVSVGGEALLGRSAEELSEIRRKHVGFIFQNLNLLGRITVGENVMLPLEFAEHEASEVRRRSLEVLEWVGLADRFDSYPSELSGGEQQRVAIARALAVKPSLLLADEPTAALDPVTAEMVMMLIRRACDESGAGALVVTHQPATAGWADRVLHLRDGIVATRSTREPNATLLAEGAGE